MSELLFQTYGDLYAARGLGDSLAVINGHLRRIVILLPRDQRCRILIRAHELYQRAIGGNVFTLHQFVASTIKVDYANTRNWNFNEELLRNHPAKIRLANLPVEWRAQIRSICDGDDVSGLVNVLISRYFSHIGSIDVDLIDILKKTIGESINNPEIAAAVSQCLSFNSRLIEEYSVEAGALISFARGISTEEFPQFEIPCMDGVSGDFHHYSLDMMLPTGLDFDDSSFHQSVFTELIENVDAILVEGRLGEVGKTNFSLRSELELEKRFGFVHSDTGLFIPSSYKRTLTKDFDNLVKLATEDKSNLLSLSPRAFEVFMADLFSSLGYDVQLTKASRDGGVDIVCLQSQIKSISGIRPFKLAVEVKRYREGRPIAVDLVRSFVGSNRQFEADRLVYVTTSNYTTSALEYADKYAKHLLSLKDYGQICEWCDDAAKQPWILLPNSAR